jgi:hypothetical protein
VDFDPSGWLSALQTLADQPDLVYEGPDPAAPGQTTRFFAPTTLSELARLRAALPDAGDDILDLCLNVVDGLVVYQGNREAYDE